MNKRYARHNNGSIFLGRWMVALALTFALQSGVVWAAGLGITPSAPDVQNANPIISYSAGDGLMTVTEFQTTGTFLEETLCPSGCAVSDISFTISALIDNAGIFTPAGSTLTLNGVIEDLSIGSIGSPTSLLTADLTQFSVSSDTLFEFLGVVSGGALSAYYGDSMGIILNNPGFPGDWGVDWETFSTLAFLQTSMDITSPVERVPVVASLPLLGVGLLVLWLGSRRTGYLRT